MKMRTSVKMPLFYLSTQEFPFSSSKNQIKKQNPVFSHREQVPKKKDKLMIQLYSRYLSQRDISLSSTNTSTHHKKMGHSKDKSKQKFDSVVIEQSSKAKLSTSINEIDQYYLDIINQKNKEIKQLKEEVEKMKKKKAQNKKKGQMSFESLKRSIEEDEKTNRNSMREPANINSKNLSKNRIMRSNCYIFKPNQRSTISGSHLKQTLCSLKTRAHNVLSKLALNKGKSSPNKQIK